MFVHSKKDFHQDSETIQKQKTQANLNLFSVKQRGSSAQISVPPTASQHLITNVCVSFQVLIHLTPDHCLIMMDGDSGSICGAGYDRL